MSALFEENRNLLSDIANFLRESPATPPRIVDKFVRLADAKYGPRLTSLLEYELSIARRDVGNCTVLDAGCGSGVYSVLFVLLGASRVIAIDAFEDSIATLNTIASRFGFPIESRVADVSRHLHEPGSIDFIYCLEAISHIRDWEQFLEECARMLSSTGTIIIGDGNNGANPKIRREIYDFWEVSERGPFDTRASYTGNMLPYLFRRWMLIRQHFPGASDHEVYAFGLHASHLGGGELIEACRIYLATGQLPGALYRRGQSQVRPEDGQHNEEPVHPAAIAARLRRGGLRVQARPHFGYNRSPLLPVLNAVASHLGPMPLFVSPRYLVVAHGPGEPRSRRQSSKKP